VSASSDTLSRPVEQIKLACESRGSDTYLPEGRIPCYFDERDRFSRTAAPDDLQKLHQSMSWAGPPSQAQTSNATTTTKRRRQEGSPTPAVPVQLDAAALKVPVLFCFH